MDFYSIQEGVIAAAKAMTLVEILAVAFGVIYVVLAAKESIWCWPAAVISVGLYIYLCIKVQLYAETALQVFYLVMAFYGWWVWAHGKHKNDKRVIITWPLKYHAANIAVSGAITLGLGYILGYYTEAKNPFIDSFTTVFALVATFMVARKVLENWLYWIVIDAVSIYLYASRELYLTALLFLAYTIIALVGYLSWKKAYDTEYA